MRSLFVLSLMALVASANLPAPGTCGPWVPQTNGSKWRLCLTDQGQQYCQLKHGRKQVLMECP